MIFKQIIKLISIVVILIVPVWFILGWVYFINKSYIQHEVQYTVREGVSMRTVIDELYANRMINHPRFFKLLVSYQKVGHKLKAGEYLFTPGTTPSWMLKQIVTGTGMVYHAFTIIPGWNMRDIKEALEKNSFVRFSIKTLNDQQLMSKLGYPNLNPEGQFFPDTYFFVKNTNDLILLKQAFKKMQTTLAVSWQHRASHLPFNNPYEALIGASIIIKEAKRAEELPIIAGVLINRLKKDMLLQFDPTVIYGNGSNYEIPLRKSDLLKETPYNTYLHKGLPPTPISMPDLAAIHAILHPTEHDYYYFVAKGDGSHQFSKDLNHHYKAVAVALVRKNKNDFFNIVLVQHYLSLVMDGKLDRNDNLKKLTLLVSDHFFLIK